MILVFTVLAECGFDWEYDRGIQDADGAAAGHIIFSVDGVKVLEAEDDSFFLWNVRLRFREDGAYLFC